MPGGAKQTGLPAAVLLLHAYTVCTLNTYWVVLRVVFMPIESDLVNRQEILVSGVGDALRMPLLYFVPESTYFWYSTTLNGVVGALAFTVYGLVALSWLSKRKAMRVVAGVALAVCVCISLVFVASTPVLQWYELIIKLSLLAALTGLGIASEKLCQKLVDRLAGDEKEWSPS